MGAVWIHLFMCIIGSYEVLKSFSRNDSKYLQILANMIDFLDEAQSVCQTTRNQLQHRAALVEGGCDPRVSSAIRNHHCCGWRIAAAPGGAGGNLCTGIFC